MTEQSPQNNQIQIKATDETLKGVYSNAMQVLHTKQEFVLDFMNMFPPTGTLNARVIVSPAHLKQIIAVLADNLGKYETSFGSVVASELPAEKIGFQGQIIEASEACPNRYANALRAGSIQYYWFPGIKNTSIHEEFPIGRNEDEDSRAETADETIVHVEKLLDDGFYDKESCDEAIAMLNTARLLTEDPKARDQIVVLLADIEARYGGVE